MLKEYDVIIVGAGVSGTSLAYALSRFTSVKKIAVIEKHPGPALANSHLTNNSQTLHFGDIETNYNLEKATKVKAKADMLRKYVEKHKKIKDGTTLYAKYHKMILAVGTKQVEELEERYKNFKELFPELRRIERSEIKKIEPKIIQGRPKDAPVLALLSPNGYTMDYSAVAQSFVEQSKAEYHFNMRLKKITRQNERYVLKTDKDSFIAKCVVIAAGGHSLLYAHQLGYGKDYSILSVAGSFYFAPKALNGKVYTMQMAKLPFAAIHGDPDVHDQSQTRFGPTAKAIPQLERYDRRSFFEYWRVSGGIRALIAVFSILKDPVVFRYIFKNLLYDIPFIGKRLFIKEVRTIIPTMKLSDIHYAKKVGGTRPQIVNLKKKTLDMGEAKITGDNIIFNITPSPGASTCLFNAYKDAETVAGFLGEKFRKKDFEKAYS